ncbi:MAG: carbohydrate ABC transporter permease [Holosporales bacterium]|jgi:trehalose/maltose transport system permease protein|nr:carbohydrate ABC transporter permease [Holosporales bacterium]
MNIALKKLHQYMGSIFFYTFCAIIVLLCLFPFYWAIVSSLKSGTEIFATDLWPKFITFQNYSTLFQDTTFSQSLLNSTVVALSTVGLALLLAMVASFALARIPFRGRKRILLAILSVTMFPQVAVLSGMFELVRVFGLYNHRSALILSYMTITVPFTTWTLTSFMREVPKELEEAAIMDGAGYFTILTKIFLPILSPALVTTGLLAFIAAWNEFLFALTFTLTNKARTIPVTIALLSGASQHELPWGNIMAASVIVTLPLVALIIIFQRRIISGLTAGAVKG